MPTYKVKGVSSDKVIIPGEGEFVPGQVFTSERELEGPNIEKVNAQPQNAIQQPLTPKKEDVK